MCPVFFHRLINIVSKSSCSATDVFRFWIGRTTVFTDWLMIFLLSAGSPVFAQWVAHGPAPNTKGQVENIVYLEVVGAINAVVPHPTDANTVYVGAVNGGIWKTINARDASPLWVPQTDYQQSLSIGALEFDPLDATNLTLVAGIGSFSSFGGRGGARTGPLRTTDGGTNWIPINGGGILNGLDISGIAPRGNIIVISTISISGIWRSTNTGANWTQISSAAGTGLPAGISFDLAGDPSDPTRLYTNAGTNGIYRSIDTGANWIKVSNAAMDALINLATNNIEIAVGTSNTVYVAIVNGGTLAGLFRSGNGGGNWIALDLPTTVESGLTLGIHPGGYGYIHLSIAADPADSNIVYIGGDRQPGPGDGAGIAFPNSIGAQDFSGRLFRVDAS